MRGQVSSRRPLTLSPRTGRGDQKSHPAPSSGRGDRSGPGGLEYPRWEAKPVKRLASFGMLGLALLAVTVTRADDTAHVTFLRTPEGTFQPQALADRTGTIHVVALSGDPGASDVVYY